MVHRDTCIKVTDQKATSDVSNKTLFVMYITNLLIYIIQCSPNFKIWLVISDVNYLHNSDIMNIRCPCQNVPYIREVSGCFKLLLLHIFFKYITFVEFIAHQIQAQEIENLPGF